MLCFVYKSRKKSDAYLFVERKDDFSKVPDTLREMLGELEFVMEVDLAKREQLARIDSAQLRSQLSQTGYYLQFPPATSYHNT